MKRFFLSIILMIALSSCGTLEMGIVPAKDLTPTSQSAPTQQVTAELPTQVVIPTATIPVVAIQSTTVGPQDPTNTAAPQMVKLFFIALEDNGQSGPLVGCGDSVVAVQVQIEPTQAVLKTALDTLLANKSKNYGESGLYNVLYEANLKLDRAVIKDGVAYVDLSGTLQLRGECDNPRVQAQLEQTVLQFSTVTQAKITLNGKPLSEALSLK